MFSISQRVKVVKPNKGFESFKDAIGTIYKIDKDYIYPYSIKFDEENHQILDTLYYGVLWNDSQLELII